MSTLYDYLFFFLMCNRDLNLEMSLLYDDKNFINWTNWNPLFCFIFFIY